MVNAHIARLYISTFLGMRKGKVVPYITSGGAYNGSLSVPGISIIDVSLLMSKSIWEY